MSALGRDAADLVRVDVERILASQDASGAYVASPTFSQYPYAWLRDGSFIAHAMDRAGEGGSAERFHAWVAGVVRRHGDRLRRLVARGRAGDHPDEREFLPARFDVDGGWRDDDWPAFQLDGYGQWLWSLAEHAREAGGLPRSVTEAARLVADYLVVFRLEPCYDAWEEGRTQLHTSTLASVAAGLLAAQRLLGGAYEEVAESVKGFMEGECVAGRALDAQPCHFVKRVRSDAVDGSLLWLATPFELWPASDPRIEATVRRIEADLACDGGLKRYAADTFYGGGAWVLLTAWLGWHHARSGRLDQARAWLSWVDAQRGADGSLPEQVAVSTTHPAFLRYWTQRWGPPASPLLWSHAMRVLCALEIDAAEAGPTPSGPA